MLIQECGPSVQRNGTLEYLTDSEVEYSDDGKDNLIKVCSGSQKEDKEQMEKHNIWRGFVAM